MFALCLRGAWVCLVRLCNYFAKHKWNCDIHDTELEHTVDHRLLILVFSSVHRFCTFFAPYRSCNFQYKFMAQFLHLSLSRSSFWPFCSRSRVRCCLCFLPLRCAVKWHWIDGYWFDLANDSYCYVDCAKVSIIRHNMMNIIEANVKSLYLSIKFA